MPIVFVVLPVLCLPAMPVERGWTISANAGMHWGKAREGVNYASTLAYPTENEYFSLLLWDLDDVFMVGVDTRWESGKVLGLDFNLSAAIPGWPAGEMNDYDWFFTDRDWSHWSVSDVKLRWGFSADISADGRVLDLGPLSLHVGLAYHLDWWAWTDQLKDLTYSTLADGEQYPLPFDYSSKHVFRDPSYVSKNIGENAVDYAVSYHAMLAVFRVRVQNRVQFVVLTARLGPALAVSLDFHKLRQGGSGLKFFNVGFGFPWIDGTIDVGVRVSKRLSLTLRAQIAWKGDIISDTHYYTGAGDYIGTSTGAGGSGFVRGSLSVLLSWSLNT